MGGESLGCSLRFLFLRSCPDFGCETRSWQGCGAGGLAAAAPEHPWLSHWRPLLCAAQKDVPVLQERGQAQKLFLLSAFSFDFLIQTSVIFGASPSKECVKFSPPPSSAIRCVLPFSFPAFHEAKRLKDAANKGKDTLGLPPCTPNPPGAGWAQDLAGLRTCSDEEPKPWVGAGAREGTWGDPVPADARLSAQDEFSPGGTWLSRHLQARARSRDVLGMFSGPGAPSWGAQHVLPEMKSAGLNRGGSQGNCSGR